MTENSFFAQIPTSILHDKALLPSEKLLYAEIMSLTNAKGYCWASNKYFAEIFDASTRSVQGWLSKLRDSGYIMIEYEYKDGSKEISERKIIPTITKGVKQISIPHENDFTTPHETDFTHNKINIELDNNNTPYSPPQEFSKEFEILWKKYPRKNGKKKAYLHFVAARKSGVDFKTIESGLDNYIKYLDNSGTAMKYTKLGSTWFCQACWNDEYKTDEEIEEERHQRIIDELMRGD